MENKREAGRSAPALWKTGGESALRALNPLGDGPGRPDPGGPRLGQPPGDPGPVACGEEVGQGGLQMGGELQPGGVELDLRPIEEGVVVGGAWGQLVQGIDHLNDVIQLALGQGQGEVPRHGGGEGGVGGGLAHSVGVGAHPPDLVPKPLDQDAPGQHVGQGGDVLAVAVGLVKGFGKMVGDQQGEVGVLAAELGVGVAVAIDGFMQKVRTWSPYCLVR